MQNDDTPPNEELDDVLDEGIDDEPIDDVDGNEDKSKESLEQDPETTKKRLKDTQAAYTKKSQENALLKKQYDELNGKLEILMQMQGKKDDPKPEEENPFGFLDSEETTAKLLDDPKNVASAMKQIVAGLVPILKRRDEFLMSEMKKSSSALATDEGRAIATRVTKLKQDPDYKSFSDEQLSVLAKKSLAKSKIPFKGGVQAGGGRNASVETDDAQKLSDAMFAELYPDYIEKKK